MKRFFAGIMVVTAALTTIGWGSTYSNNQARDEGHVHDYDNSHLRDRDKGDRQADRTHEENDEDIRRAQGDEAGRMYIHENKSHLDE